MHVACCVFREGERRVIARLLAQPVQEIRSETLCARWESDDQVNAPHVLTVVCDPGHHRLGFAHTQGVANLRNDFDSTISFTCRRLYKSRKPARVYHI